MGVVGNLEEFPPPPHIGKSELQRFQICINDDDEILILSLFSNLDTFSAISAKLQTRTLTSLTALLRRATNPRVRVGAWGRGCIMVDMFVNKLMNY